MTPRDLEFLAGWNLSAHVIDVMLRGHPRTRVEHDVRTSIVSMVGQQRNASRKARGYLAGLRAAVGMAS